MAFEEVKAFMTVRGFADRLRILDGSSATVELAAQTLGCAPERIAKTVSLRLKTGPIVIVTAGDAKIDNRTYKHRFGEKAHLIAFDEVEAITGHAPGGVCPFALKPGVRVFLDESLKRFDSVWPAAGADHTAVFLKLNENWKRLLSLKAGSTSVKAVEKKKRRLPHKKKKAGMLLEHPGLF